MLFQVVSVTNIYIKYFYKKKHLFYLNKPLYLFSLMHIVISK